MGNVYQLAAIGRYGGQALVNTHHFISLDATSNRDLLDDWVDNHMADYRDVHPETYNLDEVRVSTIPDRLEFPPATIIEPVDLPGTRVSLGEELAPFMAVKVTLDTAFAGRRFRGHQAFGGGTESDVDGSALKTGGGYWWDKVKDYCDGMLSHYGPGGSGPISGLNWVVFSRVIYRALAPHGDAGGAATVITGTRPRVTVRTQRSRISY